MLAADLTPTIDLKTPKSVLLQSGDPEAKKEEIRQYFHDTYDIYEELFEVMAKEEAYTRRADPLRHPLIFYFGHTATFYINKLVIGKYLDKRINPKFESIFAIGVDEMSWDDLNEAHYEWPTSDEVREYRKQVRYAIDQLITDTPLELPVEWNSMYWVIMMGIEHERIHLETSSVLIRQLPLDLLKTHPSWAICKESGEAPNNELISVSGGKITQGKDRSDPLYGWDNEYGHFESQVQDFKGSKYLVSNQEFLEFIEAKGYQTEKWWTEEGWSWVEYQKAECPRFWHKQNDGSYKLRCMVEEIDMPWNWPVEINYLEAKAFTNWKSEATGKTLRLPTEAEWYRLAEAAKVQDQPEWKETPGNINLDFFASSCPVDQFSFGDFYDVLGNVWQWTEIPISGFPGFEVHPLYDDFSTPTFDQKHNLMKGGSWISTGNEATLASRYAFRRHFYQHAGFRYVETEAPVVIPDDVYENDPEVIPYCEAHYGEPVLGLPNYSRKLAAFCVEQMEGKENKRALNFGCKVGRTAFELAKTFDHVTGLDFSARTIRLGVDMQQRGYIRYELPHDGAIVTFHEKHLKDLGLEDAKDKVEFYQSDASNIKDIYTGYDLILVDGTIDRTYRPEAFLQSIPKRLNKGGLLIIASAYDWNEEYTKKENWLGGFKENGENIYSLDGIERALKDDMKRITEPSTLQLALRQSKLSFAHCEVEVTVWEKSK